MSKNCVGDARCVLFCLFTSVRSMKVCVEVVFAALRVFPGGAEDDRFTASCKLKKIDYHLKNILCQARCSGEARVPRKACHSFSSWVDFGRFGRFRSICEFRSPGFVQKSCVSSRKMFSLALRVSLAVPWLTGSPPVAHHSEF